MVETIARGVSGQLGNRVGIAPRLFLRRLVDVLDRVDEFPDFEPAKDYDLALKASEMTPEESAAAGLTRTVDDIELDLANDEPEP